MRYSRSEWPEAHAAGVERNPSTSRYLPDVPRLMARAIRFRPDNVAMEIPRVHAACPGITLGILAGGRATRLGGIDKAWLQCDGTPLVLRLRTAFCDCGAAILVSANGNPSPYARFGLHAVADRFPDAGPLAGIEGLLAACDTDWLLTLPVDVVSLPPDLIERLFADRQGAFAEDDDGPQPLIALWPVAKARTGVEEAFTTGALAVHELQRRLEMQPRRFHDFRFGNLNTPDDLAAAGITPEPLHPPCRESNG